MPVAMASQEEPELDEVSPEVAGACVAAAGASAALEGDVDSTPTCLNIVVNPAESAARCQFPG